MTRRGLADLINRQKDLEVCAQAGEPHQAMQAIRLSRPHLVIMDLSLPGKGGLELIKDIRAEYPRLFILVLSLHEEALYAARALHAGAHGYIMKVESGECILKAIRRVLAGEGYVSGKMSSTILRMFSGRQSPEYSSPVDRLTDREFEVLQLIGQGQGSREIAQRLCLSSKTVGAHRAKIKKKLCLENSSALVRYAVRWVETEQRQPARREGLLIPPQADADLA
jgi:DNA-binding NarL/FixJ family response regulator